jgi:hypothetical protein
MEDKLLLALYILFLLSCFSYARFSQTLTKASSSSPVHNLNTGLNYTTIQEAINGDETLNGQTISIEERFTSVNSWNWLLSKGSARVPNWSRRNFLMTTGRREP